MYNWTAEFRDENIVEKGRNCSLGVFFYLLLDFHV